MSEKTFVSAYVFYTMARVPIPGTGQNLDTGDGIGGNLSKLSLVTIGFAVLFAVIALGNRLFQALAETAGQNPNDWLEI